MADVIITGASRGIGAALARTLATSGQRLILVARDRQALATVAADVAAVGGRAVCVPGDLGSVAGAVVVADAIADVVGPDSVLVHNAGLWPARRVLTPGGLEAGFVTNAVAPVVLERRLLARGRLRRVMVVSAGLLVKGRFHPDQTPTGTDFGAIHTYCTTKLAGAVALRALGDAHHDVDHIVIHPGVVRTDLGQRRGLLGAMLRLVKRSWETPETCAARLAGVLAVPQWKDAAGRTPWWFEGSPSTWPAVCDDVVGRDAIMAAVDAAASTVS